MAGNHPIASGLSVLVSILEREKNRGVETLAVSPETMRLLGALPSELAKAGRRKAGAPVTGAPVPVSPPPQQGRAAAHESPSGFPGTRTEAEAGQSEVRRFPVPDVSAAERTEAWVRGQLNAICKAVKNCPKCRSLGTLFETVVFAAGNPLAEIMFVGEAPGAEEEKKRQPFVGPAGQKLDQILKAMGVKREDVYITNIVKFRPKKGDGRFQGASNRAPQEDEMAASLPYIRAEIEVVRPKVIVALGRTAAEGLLEKGGSLASFRNGNHVFEGIPVIVTYHPSYLLRQETELAREQANQVKRTVWEDMLKVMDLVGMSVTEKQRKFFS